MAADNPWISAWYDPVAGIKCFSSCLRLADLDGDGDGCLVVGDSDRKLRIFKGTSVIAEHLLLGTPVAVCSFYTDLHRPRTPAVAVASGCHVFIYRNMRPYFKFSLPPVEIDDKERELWESARDGKLTVSALHKQLAEMRDNGPADLCSRSLDILALEDVEEMEAFYAGVKDLPLRQQSVITCMETLNKDMEETDSVSSLVIGTEAKDIIILDPPGSKVLVKCTLRSIPVSMAVIGLFDVEYRVVVACRDGNIYQVKNGEVTGKRIELEAQPVGIVGLKKSIIAACTDKSVHSFTFKGKKNFSVRMPSAITNIHAVAVKQQRIVECFVVALVDLQVRLYCGKNMVSKFDVDSPVTAIRFGSFGRENHTLLCATRQGSLHIKMLRRDANITENVKGGAPPEQDVPLNVPKKTKLYVEQTQREREHAIDMHRVFQRDLCKLRLAAARSYVKIIGASRHGGGAVVASSNTSVRINARVLGFGPRFRIIVDVQNTGSKTMLQVPLVVQFDALIYEVKNALTVLPLLVPGLLYHHTVDLECIDENGAAGDIRILLCNMSSCVPIISATVNMPMTEIV